MIFASEAINSAFARVSSSSDSEARCLCQLPSPQSVKRPLNSESLLTVFSAQGKEAQESRLKRKSLGFKMFLLWIVKT
jgi:hypothetical protein